MVDPRLGSLRDHASEAGIFLDFDGTLSEIAPTPGEARAHAGVGSVLKRLAKRFRVVAVVSGRRAREVRERLEDARGVRVFGLYGLEDDRGALGTDAEALITGAERALPEVERAASYVPRALIEPKGLQVAVHYRSAPDPRAARRVLLERLAPVARRHGFRLLEGKRVVELAPGGAPTKGDVVASVVDQNALRFLAYAGDDVADLEAFSVTARLGGVRIAVRSAETPKSVLDEADLVVDGPQGLLALLEDLVA
jgi:trehalose 6-phosphate phosphatase